LYDFRISISWYGFNAGAVTTITTSNNVFLAQNAVVNTTLSAAAGSIFAASVTNGRSYVQSECCFMGLSERSCRNQWWVCHYKELGLNHYWSYIWLNLPLGLSFTGQN
jgi:hypothetical protein